MSNLPATSPIDSRLPDANDPLPLAVVVIDDGVDVVAFATGEIDMLTCGRLRDAIEPHLGPGQRVVLDLSGVTFMDSSCLRVLEHAWTTLTADGGSLILRNPSTAAHRLLSLSGMAALFAIETA